ncbi:MAG TPA: MFS transporter [Blastocatellia bacterium]|nr:MFS transporter [Blastocatellia bacterium]
MASAPEPQPELTAEPVVRQSPLGRLFRAFSYRDFRLLWFGACTSSVGTWVQQTAQNWMVLTLTNHPSYLGLNDFLSTIPFLVFSLLGGVVADRIDRRRILLTSQYLQLTFALTLALLTWFEVISIWHILTLSLLTGCVQAFGGPAYQALVPTLVARKDLANAIALNSIQFNLARVIGPAIAGVTFALYGAAVCFGLNGLSFVAVIIALSILSIRHIPRTGTSDIRSEMRSGLAFVGKQKVLRSLTVLAFAASFFGFQLATFLPVFAKDVFKVGPGGYSTLLTTSGAGAVVGALIAAWMGDVKHKGRNALLMQFMFGVVMVAFTFTTSIWQAYPLVFLSGMFMLTIFAMISSLVQLLVSDEMRGRVMSIYMVAFRGGMPLGSLITGKLIEHSSPGRVIAVEGVLLSLIALYFLVSNSQVKNN